MALPALLQSALRLTQAIYYGKPPGSAGGPFVPESRTLSAIYPLQIGGVVTEDLSTNRTFNIIQSPVASSQASVGVNRSIATTAPLHGGGDMSADRTHTIDQFAGVGVPGYVPDPGVLVGPSGYFLNAAGAWVVGTSSGVPSNRTLTMGDGLLIDGLASADLSANRTIITTVFTSGIKGVVPASGGGTANFLRADGTWAVPGAGAFISLQLLTPGFFADTGNGHISGTFLADTKIAANVILGDSPLGRMHGVQSTGDSLSSLYAVSGARYAKTTNVPAQFAFRRSRGTATAPTVGSSGDGLLQLQGEIYTANNGFALAGPLNIFQDGACLNAAGYATRLTASDGVSASAVQWLTGAGAYFKNSFVSSKPTPAGVVHIAGALATDPKTKVANFSVGIDDSTLFLDCTSTNITVTLPDASTCAGRFYQFKRIDTMVTGYARLVPSAGSIEQVASWNMRSPLSGCIIVSDGTMWRIVAEKANPLFQSADGSSTSPVVSTAANTLMGVALTMPDPYPYTFGAMMKIYARGIFSTTGGPTARLSTAFATPLFDSGAITMPTSVTDAEWTFEATCLLGPTGNNILPRGSKFTVAASTGAVSVYTTTGAAGHQVPEQLAFCWQWGTSSPSNSASINCASMEIYDSGRFSDT